MSTPDFASRVQAFADNPSPAAARALAAEHDDRAFAALVEAMNDFMEGPDALAYREAVRTVATPAVLATITGGELDLGDTQHVQLWPHRHGTDAMFIQLISKV